MQDFKDRVQKLKRKYETSTLNDVEKEMSRLKTSIFNSRVAFIAHLSYLKLSKKFRDDKLWSTEKFDSYVKGKWNMTPASYRDEVWIYNNFIIEAKELGIHTIARMRKLCGSLGMQTALKDVRILQSSKSPTMDDIDKIIFDHLKDVPENNPNFVSKSELNDMLKLAYEQIDLLKKEKKELIEQNSKLKKTVKDLKKEKAA